MDRTIISPSNLARRRDCPGSVRLESQVPATEDAETEWSAEGALLHRHLADTTLGRSSLTESQRELVQHAERLWREVLDQITAAESLDGEVYFPSWEVPLSFDSEAEAELMRGTCDFLCWYPNRKISIIIDAKFGYAEVTHAADNLQLSAYAAMAEEPADKFYVAIVQPRAGREHRVSLAVYTRDYLVAEVRREILRIHDATTTPDAPLNPSEDACRYCRAKLICPAYTGAVTYLETIGPKPLVQQMNAETLGRLADCIKLAKSETFGDMVMEEVSRRIERREMPGWLLKDNGSVRELKDVSEAFSRFKTATADSVRYKDGQHSAEAEFLATLSPSWGKMEALYHQAQGGTKAAAQRALGELLQDLTTRKPKAPTPIRHKKALEQTA